MLLVTIARLADNIMPAIIPTDAGFFADDGPNAMTRAELRSPRGSPERNLT
jgi:hypothetical protein